MSQLTSMLLNSLLTRLGGVEVDVQDYELQELNRVINEMNHEVSGEEADLLEGNRCSNIKWSPSGCLYENPQSWKWRLRTHGTSTPCHYISRSKSFLI